MTAPRYLATWRFGVHLVEVYEVDLIADGSADGEFDPHVEPWAIRVAASCQGARRWVVLFHELAHVAVQTSGLRLTDEREEVLASALEQVISQAVGQSLDSGQLGRDLMSLSFAFFAKPSVNMCSCHEPFRQHRLSDGAWRCGRCTLPLSAEEVHHAG